MKKNKILTTIGTALLTLFFVGCSDILEEHPRSIYTPEFFKTEEGVKGGVTALYYSMRNLYGYGYYHATLECGTDEYTYAESADGNFWDVDLSGQGEITTDLQSGALWSLFPYLNTASGIIENAAEVGIEESLVSEARFFRSFYYFMMVQTFGGVPLDLGAGELKFNSSPSRVSIRNTVPEVYTKAIFPDLLIAVDNLPDAPRLTGTATKTLARLMLAKAYLTYGWWLENPNDIPTYPAVEGQLNGPRTDPDGHPASWYFQQAYDIALAAINDPGPFGLQPTFYDVHIATNDRHNEMLLYADHTETDEIYGAFDLTYGSDFAPDNTAVWMMTSNYTSMVAVADDGSKINPVQREAAQAYGRPWTRMCPPIEVHLNTFTDKSIDSRWDGTFVTTYRANWTKNENNADIEYIVGANDMEIYPGDAVYTFLPDDSQVPDYSANGAELGGGVLPGRADWVVHPSGMNARIYPGLWKLGTYRTDNEGGLGSPNGSLTRPFPIAKFSELYLVAAEAAVKGASGPMSARELLNVLRARAGKWRWDNRNNVEKIEDHSAEMVAATPQTIDIDYVLAERSRELFGEGYRWFDLIRTQKWGEVAATVSIGGNGANDHTPVVRTRDIPKYLYLRPIPQTQMDSMEMDEAEKSEYQNPGYN